MKEKKMFLILLGIVLVVVCLCVGLSFFFKGSEKEKTDAVVVKELYESLNDKEGYTYVTLEEDNPYVFRSVDDIIKIMKEKSGVILFATHNSNASRNIIYLVSEVARNLNYGNVVYLDISDIRDLYELDEKNKPVIKSEGTSEYKELLKILGDDIMPYVLESGDGVKVSTGENRIYLPTLVGVYNGKVVGVHTIGMDENKIPNGEEIDKLTEEYKALFKAVIHDTCDEAC